MRIGRRSGGGYARKGDERATCVWVGWIVGLVTGGGLSGFAWMNPYIALSLTWGGLVLYITALKAVERS